MDNYFDYNGRPLQKLTGEIWNKLFENEKTSRNFNNESFNNVCKHAMGLIVGNEEDLPDFNPYADYLISAVQSLLNDESDYCYYLYNIRFLLSIFGDSLESRYISESKCFEVWLNESKLN